MRELQCALHRAAEQARLLDTRKYELEPRARVRLELVPCVTSAVDEAVGVLVRLLDLYDSPSESESPENSGVFDARFEEMVEPANEPAPRQRVADVSFMARWELDRKRSAVSRAEHRDDEWGLLSECCSARRRVVKATSGVEHVLSEVEGCPSVFEGLYRTERQLAIETRAAYHSFVCGLRRTEDAGGGIAHGIRLAGTGIARLVGRDIYQELWVVDRLEIRKLQRRLFDWLLAPGDLREGQRLMSDVQAFAALLMQVNRRPVLIEHDLRVLHQLRAALRQPATDETGLFPLLVSIRGRDRDLDALIDAYADLRFELWDATVERVLDELCEQDGQ